MPNFTLKPERREDAAAIIVSFDARWASELASGAISVVFRKKGPTKCRPKSMYAYLSMPVSAIVARCPIREVRRMPVDDAVTFCDEGRISEDELRRYAGETAQLFVIRLEAPLVAQSPITLSLLMEEYDFWPTANFISLSEEGVRKLDAIGRFQKQ